MAAHFRENCLAIAVRSASSSAPSSVSSKTEAHLVALPGQFCRLFRRFEAEHCRSGRRCAVAIRGDEVNEEELATRKSPASPTPPSCVAENLPNFNKAKVQKLMLGGAANLGEIFRGTPEKLVEYLPDDGDTLSLLFNFNFRAQ